MTRTLNAYRTPPQKERKAAAELREAGIRAYVPTERITYKVGTRTVTRRVPVARGYVFGEGKPYDAEHVREKIPGHADRDGVRRLYVLTSATQRRRAFQPGDAVIIKRGRYAELPGTIADVNRGHFYDVRVVMFAKTHTVKLRESDLARAHPGTK
jgi:transcription antitermination factor NusG